MINRNDITIAVTTQGYILAAQGRPARERLLERDDIADYEGGLYYSQLGHRCGYHDGHGYRVGTPTAATAAGSPYLAVGRIILCAGPEHTIGIVQK
ncbi:MAG: hypothetical protein GY832_23615 [Chloroflexi bacterium]|nr:hypothetical protein [Chloroflexota bacterium]